MTEVALAAAAIAITGGIVTLLAIPRSLFLSRRSSASYRRWMKENGLTEVSWEDRILFKGTFFGAPGSGYTDFRVEFRDERGETRKAFLRCGDNGRGLLGRHDLDV